MARRSGLPVVGIDLAGSEKRGTGFCVMDPHMRCRTAVLHTNQEVLRLTSEARPGVVSIDAPLFLPKGGRALRSLGLPISGSATRNS